MAFDPIFRCLQEVFNPKNPDNLDFLQPTQCAYADDLAVAAMFFRELMTALTPAFRSVDYIAGLNLNYRNAVGFGTALKDVNLCGRVSENCEEFREMQIVRHAEYVGPEGHIHCWSAPRKIIQRVLKNQCVYQEPCSAIVRLQDLCDFCDEFYWLRLRTRQGNPQGREPCPSVYNCRSVQRKTV